MLLKVGDLITTKCGCLHEVLRVEDDGNIVAVMRVKSPTGCPAVMTGQPFITFITQVKLSPLSLCDLAEVTKEIGSEV